MKNKLVFLLLLTHLSAYPMWRGPVRPEIIQFVEQKHEGVAATIRTLLPSHGAEYFTARDPDNNQTALHVAAQNGIGPIISALLACRPLVGMIDEFDSHGNTALHYAAKSGAMAVQFLLAHGANKELRNAEGRTAREDASSPAILAMFDQVADRGHQMCRAQQPFQGYVAQPVPARVPDVDIFAAVRSLNDFNRPYA